MKILKCDICGVTCEKNYTSSFGMLFTHLIGEEICDTCRNRILNIKEKFNSEWKESEKKLELEFQATRKREVYEAGHAPV